MAKSKLKEYRLRRGLSVRDLSIKAGCTDQTVYNLEKKPPRSLVLLRRIAKILGYPLGKVFPE